VAYDVVIAGGGFGGFYAARRLERRLPRHSARIVLVTNQNFMLYTPLLPGAAAGTLEPRHVVVPLREELEWTDIRLGNVTGADPAINELSYTTVDGRAERLRYDQLVVALGSVPRVLPVPGLAEHGVGFQSLADAIALRNRVVWSLEVAEAHPDDEVRSAHLTFVFVGAGYAGVEGIAELQDYVADLIDRYPRCRLQGARFILVEAQDRIMPEIPPGLAAFATRELRRRGIEIRTGTMLEAVGPDWARLSTGEQVPARTVAWTAGVRPAPAVARLGLPLHETRRIDVDATMRVKGRENVWAIGDAAAVPDPAKGRRSPTPPTAQHSLRQGKVVADNVAATLAGSQPRPFRYRTLGVFVDMGRHKAVTTMVGIRLRGFPAWFAARTYHLALMPGVARRLRLVLDWTVGLFFGRAAPELGQLGHPPPLASALEEQPQAEPGG
jgi:NADH dehydrogenase